MKNTVGLDRHEIANLVSFAYVDGAGVSTILEHFSQD